MTIVYLSLFIAVLAVVAAVYYANENFRLRFRLQQEQKGMEAKAAEIERIKSDFAREFENISNRVLKMQKEYFASEQKTSLSNLLSPFQNQMKDFREMIEKTNLMNQSDKGALKRELDELKNLNTTLSKNADSLANALKGNSKVQGDWGERQLKTILDMAGLSEGIDYYMQANLKGEAGRNLRPDCIINLPNGKKLVVDSKVSITNYVDFVKEEEDAGLKKRHLESHVRSIRQHISDLSTKEYQKYLSDNSLDFVFMFIPNEHAYLEALKYDNNIYDNAYKSNVAITTPSSILPILRTVRNLWSIERQNQNASIIAERAGRLYDKLSGFVDNMKKVDNSLLGARKAYDDAFAQLSTGRGSAISIAEGMKALGAKTAKSIDVDKHFQPVIPAPDAGIQSAEESLDLAE
ncbi:MAG: DNA recombination protein RmuC [Rickettsiales bacterium]|jgi:DNA recombination protein RmuC|nr:DNA recombination protein RmuC [Rickettsiales bacterium]